MVVIEKKNKEVITLSFSGKVGTQGLGRIKDFIELVELSSTVPKRKVSKSVIDKLADEVTAAAWKRIKKERGLNDSNQ